MAQVIAFLLLVLLASPVAAEVGTESLVGGSLITPARTEDWQPAEGFVCPANYRCQYNNLGWSVYVESSIAITPATGSLEITSGGTVAPVAMPELAILHRFPRHIFGRQLASLVNPSLQHATAWGAAAILRALQLPAVHRGIYVDLPRASLEVQEWCSGLVSMKWLLLLAVFIALVGSGGLPWKIALVVIAPLIALEANVLRVAGFGLGLEVLGHDYKHALKDGTGWVALMLGVVQVVGLGRLMNRRRA